MESRESQRDKRIQGVLNGTKAGGGGSPSASVMRAREELQGIDAERVRNLEQQKAFMNGRRQQMATMRQAAMVGAAGMAGGGAGASLQQQVSAMNPQTQAILQKYGVRPGNKTQNDTNTKTNTQQARSGPNNIKTVTTNTTNNNTRNEIRIVQPQIPMRQQAIPMKDGGGLNKFKSWLDSAFAKQDNQYEIQQKEFRKREWNLARNSSKLFQKLSESTVSLGEKMDPKNMGSTFGGQMKTLLFLFITTVIAKWWKPLMHKVANFEAGFRQVFGLPMNADLEKGGAGGVSFVDKVKSFIGIDPKKSKNKSLIEGIGEVFTDGINRLIKTLKLFVEDRRVALQKINLPEFNMPKADASSLGGMISGALGGVFKGVMAPATEYLGNILSALIGGSSGLVRRSASNVKTEAQNTFKKEYGGQYFTGNSTDWMGNLKSDSTYGMSKLLQQHLNDKSGTLHTGGIMTGLNMLEGTAKREGSAVISPQLLEQLGFGQGTINGLIKSGKASYVPMKIVQVPKSSAENEEYSGGSLGSYVWDNMLSSATFGMVGGKLAKKGVEKAGMWAAGKGMEKAFGAAAGASKYLGKAGWVGAAAGAGISAGEGIYNYYQANAGNSGFVTKAVPMSDPRPGMPTQLISLTKEGFDELKKNAKVDSFDVNDVSFQRWVEDRERHRKAMLGVKGKLTYQNSHMKALNDAHVMEGNYNAKVKEIWNDTGDGTKGNWNAFRNNSATAIANGMSWAANGLNDLNFKFTGTINAAHIPPGQARDNALKGINYLMEKYGLSKEAAAGIAGVIQKESGWNPGAENQQEKARGLKYGRGLCQWSNEWGVKYFPDWYQQNFGQRKYPNEVPLEHQLDYLMTGDCGNGNKKEEFLSIIHKPGVTIEEATKAMYLGYENGGRHLTSFSHLANSVKAYGGVSGVSSAFAKRSSAALGLYNAIGGDISSNSSTGFQSSGDGNFRFEEDAVEGQQGWANAEWMLDNTEGKLSFGNLKLADVQDIKNTLDGQQVDDSLKLGDWFVGRSANYLISNSKTEPTGYCAKYVRLALKAGGINDSGHPGSASDYIQFLPTRGFARIALGVAPQVGDIAIMPAGGTHIYGHICMYTGRQWMSDFKQNSMVVYNGGKWPVVMFRYTGKGGTGSGSLIDSGANMVAGALDMAGNVMSMAADAMGSASDSMRPGNPGEATTFDTSKLSASQMATYKWMKEQGAKEDSSGLYLEDKKLGIRAHLDLNSGISSTGNITKANIMSVSHVNSEGRITSMENDQEASDVYKGKLIGDSLALKVKEGQSAGSVVVDVNLGWFTDYEGLFAERAVTYFNVNRGGNRGITYVIHEVNGDSTGIESLLTIKVPLLDERGRPASLDSGDNQSDRYSMYDIDENSVQRGSNMYALNDAWTYLFKKGAFKYKKLGKDVTSDFHPYLHGALKITLTPKAQQLANILMDYLRGEIDNDEDKKLLQRMTGLNNENLKKIYDEVMAKGSENIKAALGITEENINKSIEDYKKGKNKENYSIWKDDRGVFHVLDKSMGIDLGTVTDDKGSGFNSRKTEDILKTEGQDLRQNLHYADLAQGHLDVNTDLEYDRFANVYNRKISESDIKEELLKLLDGRGGKEILDERKNKWQAKIGPDGKIKYRNLSYNAEDINNEISDANWWRQNESYAKRLREAGLDVFGPDGKLDPKKYVELITKEGIDAKLLKDIYKGHGGDISDELLEGDDEFELAKAYERAAGLGADQFNAIIGKAKRLAGFKKEFLQENSESRVLADALVKQYNEGGGLDTNNLFNSNGLLTYIDDLGRARAVGRVNMGEDGKATAAAFSNTKEGASEYAEMNELLHKANRNTIAEQAQKEAMFAAQFGAKSLGGGKMFIQYGDSRVVFSIDSFDTVPRSVKDILEHKNTKFYKHTGESTDIDGKYSSGIEALGEGGWESYLGKHTTTGGSSSITGYTSFKEDDDTINLRKSILEAETNHKLLEESSKGETPEEKKKRIYREAFQTTFANIQAERLEASENGGIDESNAHLGNLEDINAEQRDYLKLIAEHTAKTDEDAAKTLAGINSKGNHVESIATQRAQLVGELRKENIDEITKGNKSILINRIIPELNKLAEAHKGESMTIKDQNKIIQSARALAAQKLGITDAEAAKVFAAGDWSRGILAKVGGIKTVSDKIDPKKAKEDKELAKQQKDNTKAQTKNIKSEEKLAEKKVKIQTNEVKINETFFRATLNLDSIIKSWKEGMEKQGLKINDPLLDNINTNGQSPAGTDLAGVNLQTPIVVKQGDNNTYNYPIYQFNPNPANKTVS